MKTDFTTRITAVLHTIPNGFDREEEIVVTASKSISPFTAKMIASDIFPSYRIADVKLEDLTNYHQY